MINDIRFLAKPIYNQSYALIIGINEYKKAPKLEYAVNDADIIKKTLIEKLSFKEENITILTDKKATRKNIISAFVRYAGDDIEIDDRILVFFAGHGHTIPGNRGDTGFLVPYDAEMNDLSTFIRWDEFTRYSDLIRAKHLFFIMDACYSGLILSRSSNSGSTRFLKDMLKRFSRQILTAGKANEPVADSGGPLPNHSIFTGHLIEGINGNAENNEGFLSASGLMSYVYGKVASDKNSNQTPHYGHFDGDGDFILKFPTTKAKDDEEKISTDTLISIPFFEAPLPEETKEVKIRKIKELLSSETKYIELHDLVMEEVKYFLSSTSEDYFNMNDRYSLEELLNRIAKYESAVDTLSSFISQIAHWAKNYHKQIIQKIFARMTDRIESNNGTVIWLNIRWYPIILNFYSFGISAVYAKNYSSLENLFLTTIENHSNINGIPLIEVINENIVENNRSDTFKSIPEHARHYTPMSEYLYKLLQQKLDETLFIGKSYERVFDEFEILFAIASFYYSDFGWCHVGRFGWKRRQSNNPLSKIINEADTLKENWEPIKAGMFGGSFENFTNAVEKLKKHLEGYNWH